MACTHRTIPCCAAQLGGLLTIVAWALSLTLLATPAQAQPEEVAAWSYYFFPPFQTKGNQGLNHDLVELMNEKAHGQFRFHLDLMPRKRIELQLTTGKPGIVLFISPDWFDHTYTDSTWSEPLFADKNGILFSGLQKRDYSGPESLHGMTMGGVIGRFYKGLDSEVENGRIIREDTLSEELNVLKLAERRIDFMTGPESTLRYLVDHLKVQDKVHFSSTPLFEYNRHILINKTSPELREFVLQFVLDLPNNPAWLKLKKQYNLQ